MKRYGKYLVGTDGCSKDGHKVRDCPTVAARRREVKQDHPYALDSGAPKRNHFYALRA